MSKLARDCDSPERYSTDKAPVGVKPSSSICWLPCENPGGRESKPPRTTRGGMVPTILKLFFSRKGFFSFNSFDATKQSHWRVRVGCLARAWRALNFVKSAIAADFYLEHQFGGNDLSAVRNGAHFESVLVNERAHFSVNGLDPFGVFRRGKCLADGFRVAKKCNSIDHVSK